MAPRLSNLKILMVAHHRRFKAGMRSEAFAKELVRRGHRVTLIVTADSRRMGTVETVTDGVKIIEVPDLLWGSLRSGWDVWSLFNKIFYLSGTDGFDIIHGFESRPSTIYPIMWYRINKRIPLVLDWVDWWGRGGLIHETRPAWYRALFGGIETYYEEHFRSYADANTVITRALAQRAKNIGARPETVFWIPGGASVDHFKPIEAGRYRSEWGLPQTSTILGFSALDVTIDADLVFEAVKLVVDEFPNTLLITTGKHDPRLDAIATQLGIRSKVRQFGYVPYKRLPHLLSCADIFLLPFKNKIANVGRWPHKIGDYMALGRPTVTNPVGEMGTLFEKENVGLLAAETAEDFAAKVRELVKDRDRRATLGANARRIAEEQFSWEKIGDRLVHCYDSTIQQFRG